MACGSELEDGISYHHIFTRKVYPEFQDMEWNKISLCDKNCHVPGAHQKGMVFMANKYPSVKKWMIEHGWFFCEFVGKWRRMDSNLENKED